VKDEFETISQNTEVKKKNAEANRMHCGDEAMKSKFIH
jgi:hypothetical protein